MTSGGIPTKALAFVLVLVALLLAPAPARAALPDLVTQTVHFDVQGGDLIAGVAAFRASCDAIASGEPLALLDNETVRTTVSAAPGNCSMILILFGQEVAVPTITTTPIGRSSYYVPGLSVVSIGIVDVSLDLQSSLNSTSHIADAAAGAVAQQEVGWDSWGAQRLLVQGTHGYGAGLSSNLQTTFTYALSLGLTIWVAGIQAYQAPLRDFGAYQGTPSLSTPFTIDRLPHPLTMGPAQGITYKGASLNWTGTVDSDLDHLELWVTDGTTNVSYRITDRVASSMDVPLGPDTPYRAWIVQVDLGGQRTASNVIVFHTLATPPPSEPTPAPTPVYTENQANLVVVLTFVFIAVLGSLVAYGFGRTRGRI